MNRETSALIERLCHDLTAVRPVLSGGGRVVRFYIILVAAASVATVFATLRSDLGSIVNSWEWRAAGVALLAASFWFCWAAMLSGIPGRTDSRIYFQAGTASLSLLVLTLLVLAIRGTDPTFGGEGFFGLGLHCMGFALGFSLIPIAIGIVSLRKLAPTEPRRSGLFVGLTAAALSGLALQFFCANSSELHVATWHLFVPIVCLSASVPILAPKILRW